jgi:hypothetical protein
MDKVFSLCPFVLWRLSGCVLQNTHAQLLNIVEPGTAKKGGSNPALLRHAAGAASYLFNRLIKKNKL